jgi:hypothetical protein
MLYNPGAKEDLGHDAKSAEQDTMVTPIQTLIATERRYPWAKQYVVFSEHTGSALDLPGWLFFVIGVTIDHAFLFLKLSFPSVARVLPLWTSILHDPGVELAKQWMILDLYATRNALAINCPAVCLLANLPPLDLVGFLIHDFFPFTWTVVNILIHLEKLYD